jgi:hypothetical protein
MHSTREFLSRTRTVATGRDAGQTLLAAIVHESARYKARALRWDKHSRALGYWDGSGVSRIEVMFQRVQRGRAGSGLVVATRVVF